MAKRKARVLGLCVVLLLVLGVIAIVQISDTPSHPPQTVIGRIGRVVERAKGWIANTIKDFSGKHDRDYRPADAVSDSTRSSSLVGQAFTLAGVVKNEKQKPVAGARVSVRRCGSTDIIAQSETNDSGYFEISSLAPESFDILVQHDLYVPLIRPAYTPPSNRRKEWIEFTLPLGAEIQGIVKDEEGKGVPNALVSARKRNLEQQPGGGNVFLDDSTYRTVETSATGCFTLRGLALGENLFEIRCRGYDILVTSHTLTPENSKQLLEFILRKTGRIEGIVIDEKGTPVTSATVRLVSFKPLGQDSYSLEKSPRYEHITGGDGKFSFTQLSNEGFYDLLVEHPDFAPSLFPLIPPGTLRQVCKLERGATIRGSAVYIDRPTTPAAVAIRAEAIIKGTTITRESSSDGTGAFVFTKLPFGTYRLWVSTPAIGNEPLSGIECSSAAPTRTVLLEVYEKCTARGRVLALSNDAPIKDATVRLQTFYGPLQGRKRSYETHTNALGEFEFPDVPAGLNRIEASAKGFVPTTEGGSAQTFVLLPGEKKSDLALRLGTGGTVDGFVTDSSGRAVEGAEIQLFVSATTPRSIDVSSLKAKTDASGYFKIWGIDVGERLQMYASASKTGYAKARSPLIDLTASKPYATTQIVLTPGARISGRVMNEEKFPLAEALVEFESEEFPKDPSNKPLRVQTASDGSYSFINCTPGRGRIRVAKSGYIDAYRSLRLKEGDNLQDIDFTLVAGLSISGRLVSLEGKPIANARVRAVPHKYVPGRDETLTDKAGNFFLRNLGKGLFDVRANFALKTPDGEQSYEFYKLDVKSGTTNLEIACDINNSASGTVEGEDKRPVDNFRLTLRSRTDTKPLQEFIFNIDRSYTSARGFFRILNIPRGIYSLTLVADGYEVYQNDNLVIGPSRHTVIPKIRLKMAGGVIGYVFSSDTDRPINDVTVRLANPQKSEEEAKRTALYGRTDYSGFFRIPTAGAGTYVLELEHPYYISARINPVVVTQKRTTDLGRIYLEAGGGVQGVVIDEGGYGVNWAKVRVSGVFPAKETRTNSFGNYLIQGIRPGTWPLVVEGYANGRKIYTFRTIEIKAGETREENFLLETSAHVNGTVTCSSGYVRSGNLHIHPFDEYNNVIEDIRYDGTLSGSHFRIQSVPPGPYFLWGTGYGPLGTYTVWQTVYLERGENPIEVAVPSGRVSGNVVQANGSYAGGVTLQLMPIFDTFGVPRSVYNSLVRKTISSSMGTFAFEHVMPGYYQLLYFDPSVVGNGQWLTLPTFTLGWNQNISGITIQLSN